MHFNFTEMLEIIEKIDASTKEIEQIFSMIADLNVNGICDKETWDSSASQAYLNVCKSLVTTSLSLNDKFDNIRTYLENVYNGFVSIENSSDSKKSFYKPSALN